MLSRDTRTLSIGGLVIVSADNFVSESKWKFMKLCQYEPWHTLFSFTLKSLHFKFVQMLCCQSEIMAMKAVYM